MATSPPSRTTPAAVVVARRAEEERNKWLLYLIGGGLFLFIGYRLWNKDEDKKKKDEDDDEETEEEEETTEEEEETTEEETTDDDDDDDEDDTIVLLQDKTWDGGGYGVMGTLKGRTVEECVQECRDNSDKCGGITYNKGGSCFLYPAGAILRDSIWSERSWGNKNVGVLNMYRRNYTYPNATRESGITDAYICMGTCSARESCVGATWDDKNSVCFLTDDVQANPIRSATVKRHYTWEKKNSVHEKYKPG